MFGAGRPTRVCLSSAAELKRGCPIQPWQAGRQAGHAGWMSSRSEV